METSQLWVTTISGIYSFRGADISNILNFERDFKNSKIIKLEQNYRCTGNILKIANSVIKNNETKYEKKLWTENEVGNLPKIYSADNEYDEGNYIVEQIEHLRRQEGFKYSDFAVLYRMNTQSRAIEQILSREGVPYKVVGGLKFFERKEIKDIISYLRYNLAGDIIADKYKILFKQELKSLEDVAGSMPILDETLTGLKDVRKINVRNYIIFYIIDEENSKALVLRIGHAFMDWEKYLKDK